MPQLAGNEVAIKKPNLHNLDRILKDMLSKSR